MFVYTNIFFAFTHQLVLMKLLTFIWEFFRRSSQQGCKNVLSVKVQNINQQKSKWDSNFSFTNPFRDTIH